MVVLLFQAGAGTAVAAAYVDSVPLPADPAEPQASVLYYRDGRTILARVGTTDHSDVPLAAVPEQVRHAVLAAEDRDFYDHPGISVRGVARAAVATTAGDRQGASTITQQYARNAYLTQDFSVDRKAREFALAVKLERRYGKDEILERYLNTIYFGRGAYGIAAAAHAYFGVPPQRLTGAQGAVLAAVVKDPWNFDPAVDAQGARDRWTWIVRNAAERGRLPADLAYPEVLPPGAGRDGPTGLVVDRVERELVALGVPARALHTQGLTVVTTLDPAAQRAAVGLVGERLRGQPGLRAALVAVDPGSGGVRAYYGSDQGRGYFDYAAALHPAASTFKPIVLAAALDRGIGYRSRWDGSSPRTFPGRGGVPLVNHDGLQCPDCTLERAMVDSLNTPFYAVTERIGAGPVRDTAVALGIPATYGGRRSMVDVKGDPRPGRTRPDIAIGRYPVTPADLATVYATFAAGGERHDRHFVASVAAADGTVLRRAEPRGRRVLDAGVAADVSTVLGAVVRSDGTVPGRPAAGKTGTQQWGDTRDNQDAWMAGYTPDLAAVVWVGREKPGPIRDAAGAPIEGDGMPAELWSDFVRTALAGAPATPLPPPAHVGRSDVGDAGAAARATPGREPGPEVPVVHTAGQGRRLALTFDDGPSPYTGRVLDLLAEQHVRAVFCVVGENVRQHPELVRRIVAEGHGLCNHSTRHDDLGKLDAARARADIAATDAALAEAVPGATVPWFRAPFGSWGASAGAGVGLGHTPLGWVVDPDDWTQPGTDTIADRIRAQLTPRAVVLVHDGGGEREQTLTALRELIPELRGDGWQFDLPETTVPAKPLPGVRPPTVRPPTVRPPTVRPSSVRPSSTPAARKPPASLSAAAASGPPADARVSPPVSPAAPRSAAAHPGPG